MDHLLSVKQLGPAGISRILDRAADLKGGAVPETGRSRYVSNLFFEPSTRTKTSFEMAERRLGLEVIPFEAGFSSTLKGESLYDTVKTLEAVGLDALVVRHPEDRFYEQLEGTSVSIINAGDGSGQHPTQTLLDLFTMREEFGTLEGLKVTIAGDVSHSRVAKSCRDALGMFGAEVRILCPPEWQGDFDAAGDWDDVLPDSDVVMLLRVQHERHGGAGSFSAEGYHRRYGLTSARAERMKKGAIIMHPAPVNRGVEIADELVEHSRSRIFRQVENGVYVRMAVLETILKGRD
ncbi:aspartate carbamoyltransferase catalytic subunit [Bhargavaea ginsengi]|uniref:aspartate carbamoyltransferase catalytic subunit n=1 Tax=Bhargavaea ginsengi TaxID=426757 RepID=UPI00203EE863|nr:aspartate carbamoyltransferase catalytic subunit [Bhargavaea ginsengi]MCM3087358.1 aspartate carbamoyltransferase catalytic subunit [Bhargavaea ginsengi]